MLHFSAKSMPASNARCDYRHTACHSIPVLSERYNALSQTQLKLHNHILNQEHVLPSSAIREDTALLEETHPALLGKAKLSVSTGMWPYLLNYFSTAWHTL